MNSGDILAEIIADLPQIRADIAFARAMRQLTVITTTGEIHLQFSPGSGNAVVDLRALSPSSVTPPTQLPSQTGNAGKALITDGATTSWA